ncbi:MAG: hypothetical protein GY697_20550 [Desulfobacterales bacterium]|nr:hypothetical protein [Desulfobacterales bacterium]
MLKTDYNVTGFNATVKGHGRIYGVMGYFEDFKRVKTQPWAERCFENRGRVPPQRVGFGSGQGLNEFETGGIVGYSEDFKRVKTQPWAERCPLWRDTT